MSRLGEGVSTTGVVVAILLAVAVLVFGFIFLTQGSDIFSNIFSRGPSELQTLTISCVGWGSGASLTSIDFCRYQLIEVNGREQLVNCKDIRMKNTLEDQGVNLGNPGLRCDNYLTEIASACNSLSERQKDNVFIAGITGRTCRIPGADPYATTTIPPTPPVVTPVACVNTNGQTENTVLPCLCGKQSDGTTDLTCSTPNKYCKVVPVAIVLSYNAGTCSATPITT